MRSPFATKTPRRSALALALAATLCLLPGALAVGCGGNGDDSSSEVEGLRIEQYQSDVRFFCSSGRNDLYGAADPLGTVLTAVDNLIKIYKEDPDATYKVARIAKTGDKLGQREVKIDVLLKESAAILNEKCGRYGADQARRLEATVNA